MKIFQEFTFEAAHKLPMVPDTHKCHRLHGHNYRVRVECEGPLHPDFGWVADFGVVEDVCNGLKQILDHRYLNDINGLENPTAENIAEWLLSQFRLTVLPFTSVTVWERDDCGAIAEAKP